MVAFVLFFGFLLIPSQLFAETPRVEAYFQRTGQAETVISPLTVFGGATTTQRWSGLIEVLLSGDAINNPPSGLHVDPFWAFLPSNPENAPGTGHRFRLSFNGCAASFECGAPDIVLFMRFVDGVGFVSPPNVSTLDPIPATTIIPILQGIIPYTRSHTYRFVIDVGTTPKFLTLGDGDGGVSDNSGQFAVQLFGVVPTVPFSSLSSSVEVKFNSAANDDQFDLSAAFILGPTSNGINPLSENVTIRIGNISRTIPPGSFTATKQGTFRFDGVIDGTPLKATITPKKRGYELEVKGRGNNFDGSTLPLLLELRIGDDIGSTTLTNAKLTAQSE